MLGISGVIGLWGRGGGVGRREVEIQITVGAEVKGGLEERGDGRMWSQERLFFFFFFNESHLVYRDEK